VSKTTKKSSKPKKIDTAIIVALITLVGILITAILSSPVINTLIERLPSNTHKDISPATSTSLTAESQDTVEMIFMLPSDSEPAKVTVKNNSGVTVLEIHVLPDTKQTVKLPSGDYTYTIESDYVHMAKPCTNVIQFDMRPFTVGNNNGSSLFLPSMGRVSPIPNCTPSP